MTKIPNKYNRLIGKKIVRRLGPAANEETGTVINVAQCREGCRTGCMTDHYVLEVQCDAYGKDLTHWCYSVFTNGFIAKYTS